jgi:hypothetical protein
MACNARHGAQGRAFAFHFSAEVSMMAAEFEAESDDFVGRLSDAFQRGVFQPMFQKAPQAPADVRDLIAELRDKLDLLDRVIAMAEQGKTNGAAARGGAGSEAAERLAFDETDFAGASCISSTPWPARRARTPCTSSSPRWLRKASPTAPAPLSPSSTA